MGPGEHGAPYLPEDADLDLLRDFIAESREAIARAEAALLSLEHDPSDDEAVNVVFRAFHTIKGTSSFLGLDHVTTFAHHAESLLTGVRDRTIPYTSTCAELALGAADMLKALLDVVGRASPGGPLAPPAGYSALLDAVTSAALASEEATPSAGATPDPIPAPEERGERHGDAALRHELQAQGEASIRVRTDRLDRLIDMVGELVIAQAMVAQNGTVVKGGDQELLHKVANAGKIVRSLRDLSMSMRMVPLRSTFQKMARLTRDAAQRSGKQVELLIEGEDTEVDRNMVDVIGDPLVHMIRNAVDHGIETAEVRAESGKPATGSLRLSAGQVSGTVVVELEDDGRGLDRERILRTARARGLIEDDRGMSDADVHKLIFAPGFTTSDGVTDLSGRGVGMDVVRRNVEALHGRVDIASEPGKGCRLTLRLPITLAMTDGMLVRIGAERYLIPSVHIQVIFRPGADALSMVPGRGEMVRLRDDLMPLIRLDRLFDTAGAQQDPTAAVLVVTGVADQRYALLVDELVGQHQVIAKPIGDGIVRVPGIAGGAILGDGRVGLILDVPELVALDLRA